MALVLYRKYRPQKFSEVVGQEAIIKTLENTIVKGRVGHAYLFAGPRGVGKTTVARIVAKAVNCLSPKSAEPCDQCLICQSFRSGAALDLIEIDAASNRGIDEIRQLRDGIRVRPAQARYKIFIIDEVHMLTKEAFNALLKTLEEPPAHAIFILATTEIDRVPATIISRCQRFDFKKLKVEEILSQLEEIAQAEKIKYEPEALSLIAQNVEGSMRDAINLLDQVSIYGEASVKSVYEVMGLVDTNLALAVLVKISQKDLSGALQIFHQEFERGTNLLTFLNKLIECSRQLLLIKLSPIFSENLSFKYSPEQLSELKKLAMQFSPNDLQLLLQNLIEAQRHLRFHQESVLPIEIALVDFYLKTLEKER